MIRSAFLPVIVLACSLVACGSDPKPPPKTSGDEVPANSAAEAHLQGATAKPTDPTPLPPPSSDPGTPVSTPVTPTDAPKPSSANAGEKVSKSECDQALGRAFDLAIPANDPRLAGLPPEVMQQLKAQSMAQLGQQNPGDNPCNGKGITRAQYDCEMAASTLDQYKKCEPKDAGPGAKPGAKSTVKKKK